MTLHELPLWAMGGIMVGGAVATAGMIGWATRAWYRRTQEPAFDKWETMLGVLAVLTALLVTFLANNVWTDVTEANHVVRDEARALQQAINIAESLPRIEAPLRALIHRYVVELVEREWDAMARDEIDDATPSLLRDAERFVLAIVPENDNERLVHGRLARHLEAASEARFKRLEISHRKVAPLRWAGVLVAIVLTLITIAVVHVRNPRAQVILLGFYATSIGAILLQILAYDRPFVGAIIVGPEPFLGLLRLP